MTKEVNVKQFQSWHYYVVRANAQLKGGTIFNQSSTGVPK